MSLDPKRVEQAVSLGIHVNPTWPPEVLEKKIARFQEKRKAIDDAEAKSGRTPPPTLSAAAQEKLEAFKQQVKEDGNMVELRFRTFNPVVTVTSKKGV